MSWILHWYPEHDGQEASRRVPEEKRLTSGTFLIACDAECGWCGYTVHPPRGGVCPACQHDEGELTLEGMKEHHG